MYRIINISGDNIKYFILTLSLSTLLISSKNITSNFIPTILPTQCYNNEYLDKLLDSLKIEESDNGKRLINYNYKHGKIVSIDEGPYQHNSKYQIYFADTYNCGRRYNPYNEEIARNISRQILVKNYKITRNYFDALVAYNCGIDGWKKQAPYKSFLFAEHILRRLK